MKILCTKCNAQGFLEKRGNSYRIKHYSGYANGKRKYTLHTMTKAEIILTGTKHGVDFSLTLSCYDPDEQGKSCGRCDSCRLRLKGFAEAGLKDPIEYKI